MSGSGRGTGTSGPRVEPALARSVRCEDERILVTLTDGRVLIAPLTERLREATKEQRQRCRIDDYGTSLRWDDVDEDLSVAALLGVPETVLEELAGFVRAP